MKTLLLLVALLLCSAAMGALNGRPHIGIMMEPSLTKLEPFGEAYIAASYVKWAEAGGAIVVPLNYSMEPGLFQKYLSGLNAVLFPGGGVDFDRYPEYMAALKAVKAEVVARHAAGDVLVLWGTCLGFEEVGMLFAEGPDFKLDSFDAENISLPLIFSPDARKSKMFEGMSDEMYASFAQAPLTMNNHMYGISPASFEKHLASQFRMLSTSKDKHGVPFVSTMEHKTLPVFAVQWHPEKPIFEWNPNEAFNHSPASIAGNLYMARFLGNQARLSSQSYASEAFAEEITIFHHAPIYSYPFTSSFEQSYMFGKAPSMRVEHSRSAPSGSIPSLSAK